MIYSKDFPQVKKKANTLFIPVGIKEITHEEESQYVFDYMEIPFIGQPWYDPVWVTEEILKQTKVYFERELDQYIDSVADAKEYGRSGITPSAACLGYASFPNEFQAEAIAYGNWIASLWPVVWQIMSDVQAGLRDIPTKDELISELPEMVWPT